MDFVHQHRALTALSAILMAIAFVAGFVTSTTRASLASLESRIGQVALPSNALDVDPEAELPDTFMAALTAPPNGRPLNILLVGSDTRSGQDDRFGSDEGGSGRSDTTMLVHVAADRSAVTVMSIPRDLWLTIPECVGPAGDVVEPSEAKFNDAYQRGGVSCTIKTVRQLTGVPINHVAVVDFAGFEAVVDALGGIPVCLEDPIRDPAALLNLPAGEQVLNGQEALGVARARENVGDGSDLSRIGRQQALVLAIASHAKSANLISDPGKLYDVLAATLGSISTDEGLASLPAMASLLWQVRNIPLDRVTTVTVPVQDRSDGVTVALVQPEAKELFTSIATDRPATSNTPTATPETAPETVPAAPTPTGAPLCTNPLF